MAHTEQTDGPEGSTSTTSPQAEAQPARVRYEVHSRVPGQQGTIGVVKGTEGYRSKDQPRAIQDRFTTAAVADAERKGHRVTVEYVVVKATTTYEVEADDQDA